MQSQFTSKRPPRDCEQCGIRFQPHRVCAGRPNEGRFCGRKCGNTHRAERPLSERIANRITKTESCWFWTGATTSTGYGRLHDGTRWIKAHRASYMVHCGEIPAGQEVCHRCDTPLCVNPDHLFLGSHADNMRDMSVKGRVARGERKRLSVLTEADVRAIRAEHAANGTMHKTIAAKYGISRSLVGFIIKRKAWKHVE